jgi:Ca2+-binding RTX toxin-like protein
VNGKLLPALRDARLWGVVLVCAFALVQAGSAEAAKCTLKGTGGVDVLKGTKKADVLCGKGGDDVLIGKGGDDVLKGADGKDILTGKSGNDSLAGGAGDDTLAGGKGDDELKGQAGIDVAAFADSPAAITVDLGAGTASGDGADTMIAVENVIGSSFNDLLTGDAAANELSAGDGDDAVVGGAGNDTLKGQGGADSTSYAAATDSVTADMRAGTVSGQGTDAISGIENLTGSPQADTIVGDDAANILDGAGGRDTVSFAGSPTAVNANLGAGGSTGDGADTLIRFEDLSGSAHNDKLSGDAGANALAGGEGDDTLAGADGDDQLTGQGGADAASYASSSAAVNADLRTGLVAGQGSDTVSEIENLVGSPQSDNLAGDAGPNTIDGGGGADTISFAASQAPIDVNLVSGLTVGDGADVLVSIENVIGSPLDDSITGDAQANAIAGGLGNDTVSSAGANDHIFGQEGNDNLYGDDGDDDISGGPANDHLDGGTGTNVCDGGPGTNTFAGNCDGGPPVLTAFTAPASVDTNASAQPVNFTLSATDDASGVDPAASKVIVHGPGSSGSPTFERQLQLASGGPLNGNYTAAITLPRYSPQGTWTIEVKLVDNASNQTTITSTQLVALTFRGSFQQSGVGDLGGPALTNFTLAPPTIDTSGASASVNFDLTATDDLSGIDPANSKVIIHGPSGAPTFAAPLQFVSGSATNGVYHATITVPRYSPQGTWRVELRLVDNATYSTTITSAQLAPAYPNSFQQTGLGDTAPPDLTGFALSPSTTNTAFGGATVNFTLTATDDFSGVDAAASKIVVYDPVNQPVAPISLVSAGGASYTASLFLPQGSAPGTWKVEVRLIDAAGNQRVITSSALVTAGYPGSFENFGNSGT